MWPVSARFLEVVAGSHRAVSRAILCTTPQFGPAPTGTALPILAGSVKLASTAQVQGSLDLTVPGDYWDLVQPWGNEVYVERGVDFGDGTRELVPLGYYRIEDLDQDDAPAGPIKIAALDRSAQLQQNRVLYPYQVPAGTTHRAIFERLVNGRPATGGPASQSGYGYGMFLHTPVPIHWTSYDPDEVLVPSGAVVEDSTHEFLAELAANRGCVLVFGADGELYVTPRDRAPDAPAEYTIGPGSGGTLVKASRRVTREGVYNIVSAYGSDPAWPTGYRLAYNNDVNSPLYWKGRFGVAPRFFASPLLKTSEGADAAAETVLSRYTGLPSSLAVSTVPNPAVRPLDVAGVTIGRTVVTHVVDEVEIPLVGDAPAVVATRQLNPVGQIEADPDPTPTPEPEEPGGSPSDGTQAAVLLGWGSIVDGDEFEYSGPPTSAKWSLYDGAGHDGNGRRSPSAWNVTGGVCTCTGDNVGGGTTGGMAFSRSEYGCRVEIRARTYSINPSAGGNRYHPVLMALPSLRTVVPGRERFRCSSREDFDETAPLPGPGEGPTPMRMWSRED